MTDDPDRQCATCGEVKAAEDFSGERAKCRDCERAESEYRKEIDARLDAARPARAHAGDRSWREPVYAWARNHMPNEINIVRHTAQKDVDRRERDATHRGNRLLLHWQNGHTPLFWSDVGFLPLKIGNDHVRLDAATVADGRQFAREKRQTAKRNYDSELVVAEAAEELSEWAAEKGYMLLAQLGDLPPHEQEKAA